MSFIKTQLIDLPEHDEERFETFTECQVNGKDGFQLQDGSTFIFEDNLGWVDENGCRYDADGKADGWYVKDGKGKQYLYDLAMRYVPSDEENLHELPTHLDVDWFFKGKYAQYQDKKYLIDEHGGWEDDEGCYYEQEGNPAGWIIQKADGKLYLFDMKGQYVDRQDDEENDLLHYCSQKQNHRKEKLAHPIRADKKNFQQIQNQQQEKRQPINQQKQIPSTGGTYIYEFKLVDSEQNQFKQDAQILKEFIRQKTGKESVEFLSNFKGDEITVKTKTQIPQLSELGITFQYDQAKSAKKIKEIKK